MLDKSLQLNYWKSKFGDEYTKRNSDMSLFDKRQKFFQKIINKHPEINKVLEIGCNLGGNLRVLSKIQPNLKLYAIEPNKHAAAIAKETIPNLHIYNKGILESKLRYKSFDLVFTVGVLIHISDNNIIPSLIKINNLSKKYILTVEYYNSKNVVISYRELDNALFKRPYDKLWLKVNPNLEIIENGFLGKNQGFDNCHWWLLKNKQ